MIERNSSIRDLLDLMELEEFKKILEEKKKKEDNKPSNPWWYLNPIKLWLILIILYPIIGKAYLSLVLAMWK